MGRGSLPHRRRNLGTMPANSSRPTWPLRNKVNPGNWISSRVRVQALTKVRCCSLYFQHFSLYPQHFRIV